MYATITSLRLTGPLKFFKLSMLALRVTKQVAANPACVKFKSLGFWTLHYTMSLWKTEADLKAFAKSGAHLDAMKRYKEVAAEIRTYTYATDQLPDWKTAKELLGKGRVIAVS